MKSTFQMFFCGTSTYEAGPVEADLSLPDPELFEQICLAMALQWSSTGDKPHHRAAMQSFGEVKRAEGYVLVRGQGWQVQFEDEAHRAKRQKLLAAKDWKRLGQFVVAFDSVWTNY